MKTFYRLLAGGREGAEVYVNWPGMGSQGRA